MTRRLANPDRRGTPEVEGQIQTTSRQRSPTWLIVALGLGVFFAGFDQTFVVAILPDMMTDLGINANQFGRTAWIINGYLLGYTVAMPLMGRVADSFGRVRLYGIAVAIYCVGSALTALAPDLTLLAAARALQAIGGGAIVPISMAIIGDTVGPARRALAIGVVAALDDASSLLGPLYASILVDPLGWRGLFWLNIPLQLPFLALIWLLARDHPAAQRTSVDWKGGLLLAVGLSSLTLALTQGAGGSRSPVQIAALASIAIATTGIFVYRQLTIPAPLVHLRTLRDRVIRASMLLYFVDGALTITALVTIPLMTNVLWEGSLFDGGVNLMKMLIWMPVGGVIGGLACQVVGYRWTAALSFVMTATAFLMMWRWPVPPEPLLLWGTLFVLGFGIGLNDAPIIGSVIDTVRSAERATMAALTQTVQTLGMIVGTALLATQGLARFDQRAADLFQEEGVDASTEQYQSLMHATFNEVFVVVAIIAFVVAGAAAFLAGGRAREIVWSPMAGIADHDGHPESAGRARPASRTG